MSFSPVVPSGGYAGWTFLKRTQDRQQAALQADPVFKRDEAYFRAKIGSVTSAEQLVSDRRLLKVALGAFGLDADINNKFFLRKVLEDGTLSTDAKLFGRLKAVWNTARSGAFPMTVNHLASSPVFLAASAPTSRSAFSASRIESLRVPTAISNWRWLYRVSILSAKSLSFVRGTAKSPKPKAAENS